MVLPIIPIAMVGAGAAAGAGYSIFKKADPVTSTQTHTVTHSPYETYAPQKQLSYNPVNTITYPEYHIQMDSPGAQMTTKKELSVTSEPSLSARQDVAPVGSGATDMASGGGLDLLPIVLIGGVAYVLATYLKKK